MSKLLIDGDVLVYRAGFAAEKTEYCVTQQRNVVSQASNAKDAKLLMTADRLLWSRKVPEAEEKAILIIDVMIADIRARYAGMEAVVVLSGVGNFRACLATRATYKGNRDGTARPVHAKALIAHLVARGAVVSAGEEADDMLGILATENPGSIICSIDKDLMQIPGRHYNFVTKEEVTITPKEGALNFFAQVLSGDATDNVPGVDGIGPVKAKKILEGIASLDEGWARIVDVYQRAYGDTGLQFAIEAAKLVYLRRKVGEMWSPRLAPEQTEALSKPKTSRQRRVPVGA